MSRLAASAQGRRRAPTLATVGSISWTIVTGWAWACSVDYVPNDRQYACARGEAACDGGADAGAGGDASATGGGGSGGGGFGGSGGAGGTGGGSSGGSSGSGGGSGGFLGRACETDAECGTTGLRCVTAWSGELGGGSPPRGLCTIECGAPDGGDECGRHAPDVGPKPVCRSFGAAGAASAAFCLEGCQFGPIGATSFDSQKCHGRREFACGPTYSFIGPFCLDDLDCWMDEVCVDDACHTVVPVCSPLCNSDGECGLGRFCDVRSGLCKGTAPVGKGIGESCDQPSGTEPDECKGRCAGIAGGVGPSPATYQCTEICTVGAPAACGWEGPSTGPAGAYCLFVSTVILDQGGAGYGDEGACAALCDCNDECAARNEDTICESLRNAELEQTVARRGFCTVPKLGVDGGALGIPCGAGGGP